jgi:hypothetical protein
MKVCGRWPELRASCPAYALECKAHVPWRELVDALLLAGLICTEEAPGEFE